MDEMNLGTPAAEEVVEESTFGMDEEVESQTEQEPAPSPFTFELQYNKEKVVIDSEEKLRELAQKGMNYDKVYETRKTLEQQLAEVQNSVEIQLAKTMAKRYGYDSVNDYYQAVQKAWEQEELDNLIQQNIPEQYAKEMLENKRFREQYQQEITQKQQQEKEVQMYSRFNDNFPGVDAKDIPVEVWMAVNSGEDLSSAYALHLVKNLDQVKAQAQQEALKAVQRNGETSTGPISDGQTAEPSAMTVEQVNTLLASMSDKEQERWVNANIDNLEKWGYFKKF